MSQKPRNLSDMTLVTAISLYALLCTWQINALYVLLLVMQLIPDVNVQLAKQCG